MFKYFGCVKLRLLCQHIFGRTAHEAGIGQYFASCEYMRALYIEIAFILGDQIIQIRFQLHVFSFTA
jgi:hypothetical protein